MKIEFHYDFGSPNSYLVHKVIPKISKDQGIEFTYVPILLGGVFKATNNVSPAVSLQGIRNKPEYQSIETRRFCDQYEIQPQVSNPNFPVNTLKMMRGAVFAQQKDYSAEYINAMYKAMWEQAQKMDEEDIIEKALADADLPVSEIMDGMTKSEVKQQLISNTKASVDRGTFGSPTFFVGEEIYFGKDKLRDAIEQTQSTN